MNYYQILGVNEEADLREIKKAYARKIREFSPETHPEEFNKLREAYEILSSENKKAEYDAHIQYGDEIQTLLDSASAALDVNDFNTAIREYKKILLLEPKLTYARNYLALAYGYSENYEECIELLKELIAEYPENPLYYFNFGHAYNKSGRKEEAFNTWKLCFDLDTTHLETLSCIVDVCIDLNYIEQAEELINHRAKGIKDLPYYFELFRLYIKTNNHSSLQALIKKLFKEIPMESIEEKEQLSYEIGKYAYDLKGPFNLKMSIVILEKLIELYPEDTAVTGLLNSRKARIPLSEQYIEFCTKEIYEDYFVKYIYLNVNYEDFTEEEYKKYVDEVLEEIKSVVTRKPAVIINMLLSLKSNYPDLYNLQNEYFDSMLQYAYRWKSRNENFDKLYYDTKIPLPLKELIKLWMEQDITEEERDLTYQNISKAINTIKPRIIKKAISKIRKDYPDFYSLNHEYLQYLEKNGGKYSMGINTRLKVTWPYWLIIVIVAIIKLLQLLRNIEW
jgi:hypothetical protein